MKRLVIPELLDTDSGTPAQIAASLSDLRRINRWFGGIPTSQSMVQSISRKSGVRSLSLLEVAAGAGYVPLTLRERLSPRGIHLAITLLDRSHSHLRCSRNTAQAVAADALALPFADNSFDFVSCCLFAHHLSPQDLIVFVNEGLRVCRIAVLINDLIRHPLHLILVYAGFPLYRSRLTRHDAPASVQAAYTPREMLDILRRSKAAEIDLTTHYLFRMAVVVWKSKLQPRTEN
jgi:ubiquinone/menaquinone biosynthesis C-methylase UbiE